MSTIKANTYLDASGGNTATINGAVPASLSSPALTGTPTAPTATVGTDTTQIATTAFVLANKGAVYYSQDAEPSSPPNGSIWFQPTFGSTYLRINSSWISIYGQFNYSSNFGVFGGSGNTIDYINIGLIANAMSFGNLTVSRSALAGVSNGVRGVFGGGYTSTNSAVMDYITVATTGNATNFGNLTVARTALAGVSGTIPT